MTTFALSLPLFFARLVKLKIGLSAVQNRFVKLGTGQKDAHSHTQGSTLLELLSFIDGKFD